MRRAILLLLLFLGASAQLAIAQTRHVKGKVNDEKGTGIANAGVGIKNTTTGTVTDVDGNFELDMQEADKILIIQAIGFATQEVEVTGNGVVVTMKSSSKVLNETVVTALGIKREKRTLTYATQTVGGDQMNLSGSGNPLAELEGKVAGLSIINAAGDPGAGTYMQLRGITSLTGDNQPLIIIDGIPIDNSINNYDPTFAGFQASGSSGNLTGGTQPTNRGMDINPSDIESINVMKGPAATALYGIRAASGAIIITTKKGNGDGAKGMQISVNSSYSVESPNKLPELQNKFSQGLGGVWKSPLSGGSSKKFSWGADMDTLYYMGSPVANVYDKNGAIVGASSALRGKKISPYDPYDFFVNGHTKNNNIAISNGNATSSYRLSLGSLHQEGIVPHSDYDKTTFGLSGQTAINDRLNVSGAMNYVKSSADKVQQGSNVSGIMLGLLRTPHSYDNSYGTSHAADNPTSYTYADGSQRNYRNGPGYDNPYWTVNRNPYRDELSRAYGYGQASYKVTDWMDAVYRLGGDVYSQSAKNAYDIGSNASPAGAIYLIEYFNEQYNSDFMLNMHKSLNKDLNGALTIGQNYFTQNSTTRFASGAGLTLPNFLDMKNASTFLASESEAKIRRSAWYGELDMDYKKMLYLTLTGRSETTSTLAEGHNNFFYPSAGLSFIFTEPLGLTGNDIMPYGKIRMSFAQVGKDAGAHSLTTPYSSASLVDGFTTGNTWPGNGSSGYQISSSTAVIGNPDLKPEKTNSFEFGTDLSFLKNRIALTGTFYTSKSSDVIFTVPIPYTTGFAAAVLNAGVISNQGMELTLSTTPVKTQSGFRWDLNFNWSKNVNTVDQLYNGVNQLFISGFTNGGIYAIPGQPFGVIMGTDYIRDTKGNLVINDDKTDPGYGMPIAGSKNVALGNVQPNWIGSIVNNFSFKGFTLGVQIDMRSGGMMWNGTRGALSYFGTSNETMNRNDSIIFGGVMGHLDANNNVVHYNGAAVDSGSGAKNATYAKTGEYYWQNIGSSFIGPTAPSIEDGSWIRLRQLSLTYKIPANLLKKIHVRSLAVTGYVNNIIISTKYKGVDPETSLSGPANGQGLDYFNNPGTKSYGFRLNLGL